MSTSGNTVELRVPDGMTAEEFTRAVERQFGHRVANERLATTLSNLPVEVYPNTAQQLARVERLWRHLVETYGIYTSREIAELRGAAGSNRAVASRLAGQHGLRGFQRGRHRVYPRFQFRHAELDPVWRETSLLFARAGWDDDDVLLWMVSPHVLLDGDEPAEYLDQPERLLPLVERETAGVW